jgi:hypothetical protein
VLSSPAHYSHSRAPRIAAASASAATSNELISSQVVDGELGQMEMDSELELMELTAISPLDGRYGNKVKQLRTIFSEFGLIRYRVLIEVRWIQKLSQLFGVEEVPSFSAGAMSVLEDMVTNFGVLDAAAVKKQERITNHDVKAVEYVLKEKFRAHPELSKVCFPTSLCENLLWLHFQFISLPALFSSNMSLPTKLCRNMQTGVGVYSLCLYLRGHQQFSTCSDATEGSTVYCAACNGSYC